MAKWKLTRLQFGTEEFTLTEGEKVTVGRGINNVISLSSVVISRNHCVIQVQNNQALITDLQSSNGVYVGSSKITPNTPYVIRDSDTIGLGWTMDAPLVSIKDCEKYVFKFHKEKCGLSITSKLKFQGEDEVDEIESRIAKLDSIIKEEKSPDIKESIKSPVINNKLAIKRKIDNDYIKNIKEEPKNSDNEIVTISDSDNELQIKPLEIGAKKLKLEPICEDQMVKETEIKIENDLLEFEAFNVKQEYLGYDEPIQIDSESDSESEQWLMRLSQSSPGKPFMKMSKSPKTPKKEALPEDSYSQLDDFVCMSDDDEDFVDDLITLPHPHPDDVHEVPDKSSVNSYKENSLLPSVEDIDSDECFEDIISIKQPIAEKDTRTDEVDGYEIENLLKEADILIQSPINEPLEKTQIEEHVPLNKRQVEEPVQLKKGQLIEPDPMKKTQSTEPDSLKKAQMISPMALLPKTKLPNRTIMEIKSKSTSNKHSKDKSSSKRHVSSSLKEERKKKLKEIAYKEKEESKQNRDSLGSNKPISTNVKVTTSNRGAFLTDIAQAVVNPVKRIEHTRKNKDNSIEASPKSKETRNKDVTEDLENKRSEIEKSNRDGSKDSKSNRSKDQSRTEHKSNKTSTKSIGKETRVPLKSLKPLPDGDDTFSGKPVSKVGPMQTGIVKKKVRFSEAAPQVLEFQIEPGNKMKKTSSVKTTLVDVRQAPVFSLEKITLMKILRWNPLWLEEQMRENISEPPPILGHNNPPMSVFHSFVNHNQYVQLVGDLLLMEIWECLTIAYMKIRNQNNGIEMRVESLPPIPPQERCLELFSLSVNISVPASASKTVPRVGEILLVSFGPEQARNQRFFFVHNVRCLPSPSSNRHAYYSVSLHATFADKLKSLKLGELMIGRNLAYINKELQLFEAMEYLAGSPLSEAILRPEPHHFIKTQQNQSINVKSQWTTTLNASQLTAVTSSVSAALSDKPSIQMVQGPPGTGKSSVICAIVMTYFYNEQVKKLQNRGKILICATSNAAVDGLVVRLLKLRQSLPKPERFRMVRVGREEAMHPEAANISSQQLAQRDLARIHSEQPTAPAGLNEEILHIEAKINMWKTQEKDAKDPSRVAYCQTKVAELERRIGLLRSGSGRGAEGVRPEHVAQVERRIIEGADIVVTTLASAQNYKMKGLKRRISLCIIDEAGQVIEPETLIPLTLDVTRLTLIGDPQQLPGFICSQRAKKHGLNESLFSRLSSCSETWAGSSPIVLLNQQYRMHPDIADYPSRAFYDGKILNMPPKRPDIDLPPYNIISISSGDKGQGASGANEMEAWGVSRLVLALHAALRTAGLRLAVITPYNAHKDLIKRHLRNLQLSEGQVEVNTVDSFQGQERDVVVVSLARSHGVGFLTDAGRMNVMLTRARHSLLICLNHNALLKNPQWRTLFEDAQRRNMFKLVQSLHYCQTAQAAEAGSRAANNGDHSCNAFMLQGLPADNTSLD
ncbi:hypothetical protein PYW08_013344 [Mythimna loreyi]|uniref:Uncharacterized protein n=1 Tax=Mythimna loreyi TaxID=667449 RepID=A0ACC2QFX2_9NEOP|nr:hypothetical protein PYW08_013344 [Mythimna loreyi]